MCHFPGSAQSNSPTRKKRQYKNNSAKFFLRCVDDMVIKVMDKHKEVLRAAKLKRPKLQFTIRTPIVDDRKINCG